MIDLKTPIEKVARVTPVYQKRLKKLGIKTVQDLLFHFPHRYEDFSNIISIADAKLNENICIQGKILEILLSVALPASYCDKLPASAAAILQSHWPW